jgi:hypothetical protein
LASLHRERHGKDDDFARLADLMRRADKVEQRRNEVVHSIWAAGGSPDTVTRVKFTAKVKHGWRVREEQVSARDLAETAEAIRELAAELQYLQIGTWDSKIHGTITRDGDRWLAHVRLEDPPGLSPITNVGRFATVEAAQVATDEVWASR